MTTIKLRAARPLVSDGRAYPAGAEFSLAPLVAGLVLDGGRAVLVNDDDVAVITEARRAEQRSRHVAEQRHPMAGTISRTSFAH
jgi:hypothetical protein